MAGNRSERRVLVTGANGFVGPHVRLALLEAGWRSENVFLGCHSEHKRDSFPGAQVVNLNLKDAAGLDRLIAEVRPDTVIHLAAIAMPALVAADRDSAWTVNFDGTRWLAEAVLRHVPQARLVFASSSEVYGDAFKTARLPIRETERPRPNTPYASTKLAAETVLMHMVHEGLDAVCLRLFNHTGLGQTENYVVSAFAKQVAAISLALQEPVIHVGNLDARRDFLDVRDVAEAYVAATRAEELPQDERVLNIASGRSVRISDILDMLLSTSSINARIEVDEDRLRPVDILDARGSTLLAKRVLGWEATRHLSATLTELVSFWRQRLQQ